MRCAAVFGLLCFALAASAQPMFEGASEFFGETLKGTPRRLTVEREKLGEGGKRLLEQVEVYREDGKLAASERYVKGKLVNAETFEYDAQGRRSLITTKDADGKVVGIQRFRLQPDGSEEEIGEAGGKETGRTLRRFDNKGRVVQLQGPDSTMDFDYDEQGRPLEARVRFAGEGFRVTERRPDGVRTRTPVSNPTFRVHIAYTGEEQAVITMYESDGTMMVQLESTEDEAGNIAGRVLFDRDQQGSSPDTSERVDRVDAKGNWIQKTVFERNRRTQAEEPAARVYRSILYFEP